MKRYTRYFVIILIISILVSMIFSGQITATIENTQKTNEVELLNAQKQLSDTEIQAEYILNRRTVPEAVGWDVAVAGNHMLRLYEEETSLYQAIFQNTDGTKTLYLFDYPIKYVTDKGKIEDISLNIVENTEKRGSYESTGGIAQTTFSKYLSEGIRLQSDAVNITMVPIQDTHNTTLENNITTTEISLAEPVDTKTISYAYGEKTSLVYSLTYAGFKEDIVVESYTGQTEYHFLLMTDGLSLVQQNDSYYLMDVAGTMQATIGDIIVFTADEKNNTLGKLTHQTIKEREIYQLTIHLDETYLSSAETTYPIRIDPTIEVSYDTKGATAIEDVTINSLTGSSGSSTSLMVGKRDSYGISRFLMKFPGLSLSALPDANYITSATVSVRDLLCETDALTVSCYVFTGNTWKESTANWSNVNPNSYGTYLSQKTISYANGKNLSSPHRYSFDIKQAVKKWKNTPSTFAKGILFKANDSLENGSIYQHKTFASFNRATNKPSLSITYSTGISLSYTIFDLDEGVTKQIKANTSPVGQIIIWSSDNPSIATVSNSGVVTGVHAGVVHIRGQFTYEGTVYSTYCTVYVTVPDGLYYIQNKSSNLYLEVNNGSKRNGITIKQATRMTNALEREQLKQMWKIDHLNYGVYTIRTMHYLPMGMIALNSHNLVQGMNIGLTQNYLTQLAEGEGWHINRTSNGCLIRTNASSNYVLQGTSTRNVEGSNAMIGNDSGSANCRWNLIKIDPSPSGIALFDTKTDTILTITETKHIAPGSSKSLEELNLLPVVYSDPIPEQVVTWSSAKPAVATVNSTTGKVTAVAPGDARITASAVINGKTKTVNYFVCVAQLENGIYFIENRETGKTIDINNRNMNTGNTILQWDFHGEKSQQWKFTLLDDGYYTIRSENANESYYMGVSNDSTTQDAAVVLRTGTITDGMRWKVSVTNSGSYCIMPKTGMENNRVLSVGSYLLNINGIALKQHTYTNDDDYKDEWEIGTKQIFTSEVNMYYDQGYYVYYGETEHTSINKLKLYIQNVSKRYKELFGLVIYTNNSEYYNSKIDICKGTVTTDNIDTECLTTSGKHSNCTILFNTVHNHFKSTYPGNNKTTSVYWTGHLVRTKIGSEEMNRSYSSGNQVYILMRSTNRTRDSQGVLMHELNHQYGAPDHYHEVLPNSGGCRGGDLCSVCGKNKRPSTCIMNTSRQDINLETIICNECKNDIMKHLKNHH